MPPWQDVIKWQLKRNKAAVEVEDLKKLHKIYCGELKMETAAYSDIARYFIQKPALDTMPLVSSNDNTLDQDPTQVVSDMSSSSGSSEDDSEVPIRCQRLQASLRELFGILVIVRESFLLGHC